MSQEDDRARRASASWRAARFEYAEADLSGVRTYPLASRPAKARLEHFAGPYRRGSGVAALIDSLPSMLAGADFRAIVDRLAAIRRDGGGILWGLGAHVVKTGLGPVVIDLMERGYVSALATNGAGVIHDYEIALSGATSEDVDATLGEGRFGMAAETGLELNAIITAGVRDGLGIGEAIGADLLRRGAPHAAHSIAAAAARLAIPLTVHVGLGTDVIHMHPSASGAALGEGSLRDFRRFAANVARLHGGAYLNCGSAVILPEVFLKAVSLARNRDVRLEGLMTVNLDFVRLYRPETNVVRRPTAGLGTGFSLVGHHELLIPLLAAALVERAD
jgi:hypothetical protein